MYYHVSSAICLLNPFRQRRFAYENPDLLDRIEDEEDTPVLPSPDDVAEAPPSSSVEPPKKKRKRGGRTAKGEDFWSQVEKWFEARKMQWGDSWGSPGWKALVFSSYLSHDSYLNMFLFAVTFRRHWPRTSNVTNPRWFTIHS
jgi:hypothetical protein